MYTSLSSLTGHCVGTNLLRVFGSNTNGLKGSLRLSIFPARLDSTGNVVDRDDIQVSYGQSRVIVPRTRKCLCVLRVPGQCPCLKYRQEAYLVKVAAAYRLVTTTFLSFVVASIKEKREIQIKAAIKARIESTPDFDVKSLMSLGRRTQCPQMLSGFFESRGKAGMPSTLSELSVDDKVEFIWWNNDRVTPSGLLDLEGVKDSCHIRLVPGIIIDPDSDESGASFRDQNGGKITLFGVVDYGMFVYKTLDEGLWFICLQAILLLTLFAFSKYPGCWMLPLSYTAVPG